MSYIGILLVLSGVTSRMEHGVDSAPPPPVVAYPIFTFFYGKRDFPRIVLLNI